MGDRGSAFGTDARCHFAGLAFQLRRSGRHRNFLGYLTYLQLEIQSDSSRNRHRDVFPFQFLEPGALSLYACSYPACTWGMLYRPESVVTVGRLDFGVDTNCFDVDTWHHRPGTIGDCAANRSTFALSEEKSPLDEKTYNDW